MENLSIRELRTLKYQIESLIELFPELVTEDWYDQLELIKEERSHRRHIRKIKKFIRDIA